MKRIRSLTKCSTTARPESSHRTCRMGVERWLYQPSNSRIAETLAALVSCTTATPGRTSGSLNRVYRQVSQAAQASRFGDSRGESSFEPSKESMEDIWRDIGAALDRFVCRPSKVVISRKS